MPAGCDFICKNKDCKYCNSGFAVTAPWPMGQIELIIAKLNSPVKSSQELKQQLIEFKREGRKLACIVFPNTNEIKTEAYRVQLWSPQASCIWAYEIPYEQGKSVEELISTSNILPDKCPKTGGELMTFAQLLSKSPSCPGCNKELTQSRWFSKDA